METSHFLPFDDNFQTSFSDLLDDEKTHLLFQPCYGNNLYAFEGEQPTLHNVLDDGYMDGVLFMESNFNRDSISHLSEMDSNMGFSSIQDPMASLGQRGPEKIGFEMNQNHGNMVFVEQSNAGKSDSKEMEEKLMEETSLTDLLLGGAEAIEDENWELASLVIARLNHLVSMKDNGDDPSNRLVFFFTQGLHYKITNDEEPIKRLANNNMPAFQMLQELSPYIKFAHFTANQAILEATAGEGEIHVLDFDVMEGIQWPPLMVDLAMRKATSLRITAITNKQQSGLWCDSLSQTGQRLGEFADSIDLDFRFDQLLMEKEEDLVGLEMGKALIVNCMIHQLHMPNRNFRLVKDFLGFVTKLSPRMIVLVEEDLFNFAKMPSMSFVQFFYEALRHYSALSDSLLSSFSSGSNAGMRMIEEEFLGLRIMDSLLWFPCESAKRKVREDGILFQGFRAIPLSASNVSQAKLLVGLFNGGYGVQHENCRLALCWKSRPLTIASIWVPT